MADILHLLKQKEVWEAWSHGYKWSCQPRCLEGKIERLLKLDCLNDS